MLGVSTLLYVAGLWWCVLLISALGAQRKVDLPEFKVSLVYSESFRTGSIDTKKPCFEKPKSKPKQTKTKPNPQNTPNRTLLPVEVETHTHTISSSHLGAGTVSFIPFLSLQSSSSSYFGNFLVRSDAVLISFVAM